MERSGRLEVLARRRAAGAAALAGCALLALAAAPQNLTRTSREARDRALEDQRLEGQAVLELADAAMAGKAVPADLQIRWHNDFLKAQQGTFVPFTLTLQASKPIAAALVYVRAVPRAKDAAPGGNPVRVSRKGAEESGYPVDAIFPVEFEPAPEARVTRGFAVAPGDYDVYVVIRERPASGTPRRQRPRAAVLAQALTVPDFWGTELTTSSVILADRLNVLSEPIGADELAERPYVIGQNDITPAADGLFGRDEELVVVFLVYNPTVSSDRKFDLQVEYHFFKRIGPGGKAGAGAVAPHPPSREGERYFNHTDPQRFNPATMGAQFDPGAGQPVLAGQGVPLAGFEPGEYRLAIKVTDLLSGKIVMRDVNFTVGS